MKCNQDCFHCVHSDCIISENVDWIEKHPEEYKAIQQRKNKKRYAENKERECARLNEWKKNNPSKTKRSLKKAGKRWRKAHRKEERERSRANYLKRNERQAG